MPGHFITSLIRIGIWFIQHYSEDNKKLLADLCKKSILVLLGNAVLIHSIFSILLAAVLVQMLFTFLWWLLS
jgi:hypothetical protein